MTASQSTAPDLAARKGRRASNSMPTVETVQWHFHPSTGCPFWLENARSLKFDPLKEVKGFDDLKKFGLFEDEWLRGGPVRRWVPKSLCGQADLRLRDRRHDRHPQEPRRRRGPLDRLRDVQRHAPGRIFPQGLQLADARPVGSAPAAPGRRASLPVSRRHLLLRRSRSALGHQDHQEGLDGAPEGLPGPRASTRR